MSSSPVEYGFLCLAICNYIKEDAVRSEISVVEAWEIILLFYMHVSYIEY
jgi:hypothetical protein